MKKNLNWEEKEKIFYKYVKTDHNLENQLDMFYSALFKEEDYIIDAFEEVYNKKAEELHEKIVKMIRYINNHKKMFVLYNEIPLLNYLLKIRDGENSGLIIPSFYHSQALKLATGCNTAFMSINPIRMLINLEFGESLTDKGLLFILLHEAQHYMRSHFYRLDGRDQRVYNIASDMVINYSVLHKELKEFLNDKSVDRKLFKNEKNSLFVGSPFVNNKDLNGKIFHKKTMIDYVENKNLSEEEIYELILEKLPPLNNKSCTPCQTGKKSDGLSNPNDLHDVEDKTMEELLKDREGDENKSISDVFGKKTERIEKELNKLMKKYFKKGSYEESKALRDKFSEEGRKIRSSNNYGNGTDNLVEEVKKIDEKIQKFKLNFYLKNTLTKKEKNGEYKRSNNLTKFSRKTRIPDINNMLGIGNKLDIYRKEKYIQELNIICILDTSGSVDIIEDLQKKFLSHIENVVKDYKVNIVFIPADTENKTDFRYLINGENINSLLKGFKISGGGGTELLTPLLKEIISSPVEYDMGMILSDGFYPSFSKKDMENKFKELISGYQKNKNKDYSFANKEKKLVDKFLKNNKSGSKHKNLKRLKIPNIILVNTKEKVFNRDEIHKNGFNKDELLEFLI